MASAANKVEGMTRSVPENGRVEEQASKKKPWLRMEGESSMWYNRFMRYRKLGAKRSLQAAVQQEREQIAALKSPKIEDNPRVKTVKKRQKLQEVSRPKPQVPGSWKQASVQWHWHERARAWDDWAIDLITEQHINDVLTETALGIERVRLLKSLVINVADLYNANRPDLDTTERLAYIARIQSLLRDIRDEMGVYDESLTRVLVRRNVVTVYAEAAKEELDAGCIVSKK